MKEYTKVPNEEFVKWEKSYQQIISFLVTETNSLKKLAQAGIVKLDEINLEKINVDYVLNTLLENLNVRMHYNLQLQKWLEQEKLNEYIEYCEEFDYPFEEESTWKNMWDNAKKKNDVAVYETIDSHEEKNYKAKI